jgi:hypothetical protein
MKGQARQNIPEFRDSKPPEVSDLKVPKREFETVVYL